MLKKTIVATKKDKLLNIVVAEGLSYNYACKLLRNKDIKVDTVRTKENLDIFPGTEITVFYQEENLKQKYDILYEDENIYCIKKYSGIEVEGTDGLQGKIKGAIPVHRLDRNTEGLLLMAKNSAMAKELMQAIKDRKITKKYLAEVVGATKFDGRIYKAYLEKNAENGIVKIFQNPKKGAVEILTGLKTIKSNPSSSVVECDLLTGRTHQIRAHLAYLGHPIIGDGKYGKNENNKKFKEKSQKLHCFYIKIDKLSQKFNYLNGKEFYNYPDWFIQK